jgi:hypothetical protein
MSRLPLREHLLDRFPKRVFEFDYSCDGGVGHSAVTSSSGGSLAIRKAAPEGPP